MMENVNLQKLEKLKTILKNYGKICIGFSAGIDSTVLLKVASEVDGENFGIFVNSDFITEKDRQEVKEFTKEMKIVTLNINVFLEDEIIANPKNKCKFCKAKVFYEMIKEGEKLGAENFADGLNIDDLQEYRPGIESSNKLGIKHPFVEAGITKEEIYAIARHYNLKNQNKLSNSCLATRIEEDTKITKEKLNTVEVLEKFLLNLGFLGTRVRVKENGLYIELRNFENIDGDKLSLIYETFKKYHKEVYLNLGLYQK